MPTAWEKTGDVTYQTAGLSRSELYLECLPLFAAGKVEVLKHKMLMRELAGLERRTSRVGRDLVDLGPEHGDLANAVCGALWAAGAKPAVMPRIYSFDDWSAPS